MAIGQSSDLRTAGLIFDQEAFSAGRQETIDTNINAFNAASNGAIELAVRNIRGDYERNSFVKILSGLVSRRDVSSVSALTDQGLPFDEAVSVKLNRKAHAADTEDKWRKIGESVEEMSFEVGRLYQAQKQKDMLYTAILAIETALEGTAGLNFDATGLSTKTLTHGHLNSGLAKLGDLSGEVVAWVMHSKPAHDLLGQAISDNVTNVADAAIIAGSTFGLGRPIIVVDATALHDLNGSATDTYNVLGLKAGALRVAESEDESVAFDQVTGLENLVWRYQAEYAYNVECMGYKWDIANGGANPTDATLGTTTNWDASASADKLRAGVRVKVQ